MLDLPIGMLTKAMYALLPVALFQQGQYQLSYRVPFTSRCSGAELQGNAPTLNHPADEA